jgi:hypothetical protein
MYDIFFSFFSDSTAVPVAQKITLAAQINAAIKTSLI